MILGIVGPEASKWTKKGEEPARACIRTLLLRDDVWEVTSGHCPKGGVDIWMEEEVQHLQGIGTVREGIANYGFKPDLDTYIFPAEINNWQYGYRPRNIQIAKKADEMHVIVPRTWGNRCHHCVQDHMPNGGCWTAKYAQKLGKPAFWHIIE